MHLHSGLYKGEGHWAMAPPPLVWEFLNFFYQQLLHMRNFNFKTTWNIDIFMIYYENIVYRGFPDFWTTYSVIIQLKIQHAPITRAEWKRCAI